MSNNPKIVSELSSNAVLGGQDTCQGDSGGPLWTVVDGRAVLIGEIRKRARLDMDYIPGYQLFIVF